MRAFAASGPYRAAHASFLELAKPLRAMGQRVDLLPRTRFTPVSVDCLMASIQARSPRERPNGPFLDSTTGRRERRQLRQSSLRVCPESCEAGCRGRGPHQETLPTENSNNKAEPLVGVTTHGADSTHKAAPQNSRWLPATSKNAKAKNNGRRASHMTTGLPSR